MNYEKNYLIYKHINTINGKIYVGQTRKNPKHRWNNGKGYKRYIILPNGEKKPSHFWSAIQKYGWDNFEHKILIHGLTEKQADKWEKKLIKEWDLMNPEKGYNEEEGGKHGKYSENSKKRNKNRNVGERNPMYGKHHSEETKQKLREINTGKKASLETRLKIGNINRGKTLSNEHKQKISKANKGKTRSDEIRQKMSKMRKEKYASGELVSWSKGKKCLQLSGANNPRATKVIRLNNNKIYYTIQDCAKDNNLSVGTIRNHCKNKNKTGLQEFMYYDDWIKQQ